ncbi:protein BYPASS1-LIKE-like isoform X1 [Corylus avellana]|uniref:protein BYPASS1-LIKE-like isoform X1 n=2 Tax=Corylus avellana TaxID=13451 RepID=UPI001E234289|nr:protein BYPASS1-LIKE-like isoform X1 [Corylus avellana]
MPSTDNQGSSPLASFGRSIWSMRREQVHSMEPNHEFSAHELELELFQKQVSDRFHDLSAVSADDLLSIPWIKKLMDVFLSCLEEFRVILANSKELVSKPPLDRLVAEFFERSVKALDICNATRDGIEKIRLWQKHLEIVLRAFESQQRAWGEAQFRRARKGLMDLALAMLDDKDSGSVFSHRNRSFGRHNATRDHHHRRHHSSGSGSGGHSRSLSWSVSRSWSAAKQLQSIATNLTAPRANEVVATNGVAVPVFTMSSLLMFVLWVLVAAIPCQDRGLNTHFSIPRQFSWGTPMHSLHERIVEVSRKRERRNCNGLLKEIYQVERCARHMTDMVDMVQFPLTEEQKLEVENGGQELALICEAFKNGLDPLERQVSQVFRRIMNCRTEGLDFLSKSNSLE